MTFKRGFDAPVATFGHGLQRAVEQGLVAIEQWMRHEIPPVAASGN
jgi:hypothetical protein